ncbi:MAG TPA: TIGR01459 family HAD-type hydrolase [Geminicoccaceae bacterium]|nr:TIGR01459 family HAD-type hydrolase [Geminicoccus sp.]HMU51308.1 TIGR01459 family HAD-type hydrolase [Geminicoccaceae bacterium]
MPQILERFAPLAERYDAFILDQWGVLHDGIRPYPGVLDTLERLHRAGRKIVLLSNSGRRADFSARQLAQRGFDLAQFSAVVTSGETGWLGFRDRAESPFTGFGTRCLLVTRDGDRTVAEGVGLDLVDDIEDAEFVYLSGVEPPPVVAGDYFPMLDKALALGLPILCTNPDLVAVSGTDLALAPGTLAERYRAAGGEVAYVGKPHAPVYRACRAVLPGIEASAIVCVGDSIAHDIKGANDAGLASAFVTNGIHAAEFAADAGDAAKLAAVEHLAQSHGGRPDWIIPSLAW